MNLVTLYTRPGCSLCDVVKQTIQHVGRQHRFEFEVRNIADDPADLSAYQFDIPIIKVNGQEIARHRLTAQALIEALSQAGGQGE